MSSGGPIGNRPFAKSRPSNRDRPIKEFSQSIVQIHRFQIFFIFIVLLVDSESRRRYFDVIYFPLHSSYWRYHEYNTCCFLELSALFCFYCCCWITSLNHPSPRCPKCVIAPCSAAGVWRLTFEFKTFDLSFLRPHVANYGYRGRWTRVSQINVKTLSAFPKQATH